MKQANNHTRRQKIFPQKKKVDPAEWLVAQDTPEKVVLQHRHFDSVKKIIPKGDTE